MYCFGSIKSVTLPARPCVTYQILTPWLAGPWKFPHLVFFYHSLLFLKVWSWEILIYRAPAAKSNSQKTISWDYRYFRFAWCCKGSFFFFLQNQSSVDRSRVLQILTCNLQPPNYTLRKKMRFQTWSFYPSGPLRDQFLPLTIPTMTTILWIETHQPWARFVIHQSSHQGGTNSPTQ